MTKNVEIETRVVVATGKGGGQGLWLVKDNMGDPCSDGNGLCPECINVSILVVILFCSLARCYLWGKLNEGYKGFLHHFLQLHINLQCSSGAKSTGPVERERLKVRRENVREKQGVFSFRSSP